MGFSLKELVEIRDLINPSEQRELFDKVCMEAAVRQLREDMEEKRQERMNSMAAFPPDEYPGIAWAYNHLPSFEAYKLPNTQMVQISTGILTGAEVNLKSDANVEDLCQIVIEFEIARMEREIEI